MDNVLYLDSFKKNSKKEQTKSINSELDLNENIENLDVIEKEEISLCNSESVLSTDIDNLNAFGQLSLTIELANLLLLENLSENLKQRIKTKMKNLRIKIKKDSSEYRLSQSF